MEWWNAWPAVGQYVCHGEASSRAGSIIERAMVLAVTHAGCKQQPAANAALSFGCACVGAGVDGTTLKEAKYINLSLHYLEQVIIALQERSMGLARSED